LRAGEGVEEADLEFALPFTEPFSPALENKQIFSYSMTVK